MTGNLIRNMSGNAQWRGCHSMSGIIITGYPHRRQYNFTEHHSLVQQYRGNGHGAIYAMDFTLPPQANVIERNLVHSLHITSTDLTSQWRNCPGGQGLPSIQNNMVRLGLDAAGNSITTGIYHGAETRGRECQHIYFNSVYIGGTGVVSASNTFAFVSNVNHCTQF